ncbi:hypothetical protein GCM10023201_06650 [Actinomycetospora corticicola]|uniref:Uncharacterized protein n=1 Tax=Actinomycetospora corticicola TaxID=663602 RepID=A0A7Y9J498_9PSEU|nr:LmeA family phospholipid-binding protein [Actinomycetospora corticicola]NYD34686.1 hypothetical protein [Actinomycetospora corticicola]
MGLADAWFALLRAAVAVGARDRVLSVPTTAGPVRLRVASVTFAGGSLLRPGRVRDVRVEATDVEWSGLRVPRAQVHVDSVDVRLSGAVEPAGVTVSGTVPLATVQALLDRTDGTRVLLGLADGVPVLRWSRAPRAVGVEVRPEIGAAGLVLRAVALRSRRRRWRLPARLPPLPGSGIALPGGFRLEDVAPYDDGVAVRLHRP